MNNAPRIDSSTRLQEALASLGSVGVAFSGGVDSSLLLAFAVDALGAERVAAFTAFSELTPEREKSRSSEFARLLRVRHITVDLSVLRDAGIAANLSDRCYHCKLAVFSRLLSEAKASGLQVLVHGANADDSGDYRPGQKAAEELGIRAPLLETGLGKVEIRALARERRLPNWDEPSMACLASRIPYGTPLTAEALLRIDRAEELLRRRFKVRQVRVRDHMPVARIEVEGPDLPRLLSDESRAELDRGLKALGWLYVTVDLAGFKSGSMNKALP
jgi:uncharacterized protein